MPITSVITINPEIRKVGVHSIVQNDTALLSFAKEFIGGSLDHGTVAIYPSGHRLCIWVYEYGLVGGPNTAKEYFVLNGQLYNGKAILYTADEHGETISTSKALAEHLNRGNCPHLQWCSTANAAEKLILEKKCVRPESSFNGEVMWRWSPSVNYEEWRKSTEKSVNITLKDLFKK